MHALKQFDIRRTTMYNVFCFFKDENTNESHYIKTMCQFYRRTGVWKNQTEREINWMLATIITVLCLFAIFNGSYMFYLNYNNFEINTDVLLHTTISFHSLFVYLTHIYKQKVVTSIISTMEEKFDCFEEKIFNEKSNVWKLAEKRTLLIMNLLFYMILFADIGHLFQTNFYSFDTKHRKLLFPIWFPFPIEHPIYYFTLIIQIVIYSIHINVHVMSVGLCGGCANLYGAMTDIISNVLQNVHQFDKFKISNHSKYKTSSSFKLNKETHENYLLQQCIKQHVTLKRFTKEINSIFAVILIELVLISTLLICFPGYQFVQAGLQLDFQRALKEMSTMAVMVVHLFVYCWFGETLYKKNSLLTSNIYCCEWYLCSKSFRKSFQIVLLNTMKSAKISSCGIVNATLGTFVQTVKAAFSYLNILLALSTKQLNIK